MILILGTLGQSISNVGGETWRRRDARKLRRRPPITLRRFDDLDLDLSLVDDRKVRALPVGSDAFYLTRNRRVAVK